MPRVRRRGHALAPRLSMEDAAIMAISPHLEYSDQEIAAYRAWCDSWASGEGEQGFAEWERQGARMRQLLKGGMISPKSASEMDERERKGNHE